MRRRVARNWPWLPTATFAGAALWAGDWKWLLPFGASLPVLLLWQRRWDQKHPPGLDQDGEPLDGGEMRRWLGITGLHDCGVSAPEPSYGRQREGGQP